MSEDRHPCPDCGTVLLDDRNREVDDLAHRHHPSDCVRALKERVKRDDQLLRRVVALWNYVSARSHEDASAFQRELDAADGQLIEDVRRHIHRGGSVAPSNKDNAG